MTTNELVLIDKQFRDIPRLNSHNHQWKSIKCAGEAHSKGVRKKVWKMIIY